MSNQSKSARVKQIDRDINGARNAVRELSKAMETNQSALNGRITYETRTTREHLERYQTLTGNELDLITVRLNNMATRQKHLMLGMLALGVALITTALW